MEYTVYNVSCYDSLMLTLVAYDGYLHITHTFHSLITDVLSFSDFGFCIFRHTFIVFMTVIVDDYI